MALATVPCWNHWGCFLQCKYQCMWDCIAVAGCNTTVAGFGGVQRQWIPTWSLTWNLKMMFPKGISFSRDFFPGSMLNFRGVPGKNLKTNMKLLDLARQTDLVVWRRRVSRRCFHCVTCQIPMCDTWGLFGGCWYYRIELNAYLNQIDHQNCKDVWEVQTTLQQYQARTKIPFAV